MADGSSYSIRVARRSDAAAIVRLIEELATFEKLRDQVKVTVDDILRDGFGEERRFECLLAEDGDRPVAFALFFHNYSTFEGRAGIYLEDIFVTEEQRGRGIGRALVARLAALAVERECPRLDLAVLHWNPARQFYGGLGFVGLEDWRPYRLTGAALAELAATSIAPADDSS